MVKLLKDGKRWIFPIFKLVNQKRELDDLVKTCKHFGRKSGIDWKEWVAKRAWYRLDFDINDSVITIYACEGAKLEFLTNDYVLDNTDKKNVLVIDERSSITSYAVSGVALVVNSHVSTFKVESGLYSDYTSPKEEWVTEPIKSDELGTSIEGELNGLSTRDKLKLGLL